jgi:hypothetical protein
LKLLDYVFTICPEIRRPAAISLSPSKYSRGSPVNISSIIHIQVTLEIRADMGQRQGGFIPLNGIVA